MSAALVHILARTPIFQWLEGKSYDQRVRWTAQANTGDPNIVIIDVDTGSFETLRRQIGPWPWSRGVWAAVTRYVSQGQPRAILFDVSFATASQNTDEDAEFAQAIRDSGRVILPYTFTLKEADVELVNTDALKKQWSLLDGERSSADGARGKWVGRDDRPYNVRLNTPLESLALVAAGLGEADAEVDQDGTVRRVPLEFLVGAYKYPSLAVRAAALATSVDARKAAFEGRFFALGPAGKAIRSDYKGNMFLLWHGNARPGQAMGNFAYKRIPFIDVVCATFADQCPEQALRISSEYLRNKIVLVGASAEGIQNVYPTPLARVTPRFVVHATAIDNLLHGEALRSPPNWLRALAVISLAGAGMFLIRSLRSLALSAIAALAVLATYLAITVWVFSSARLWLPVATPCVALLLSYVGSAAVRRLTVGWRSDMSSAAAVKLSNILAAPPRSVERR